MTSYLLDTSVISMLAPERRPVPEAVAGWITANQAQLHMSSVSVAEIEQGIVSLRIAGSERKADALKNWMDEAIHLMGSRVLPMSTAVARIAGRLSAEARSIGRHPGFPDIVIAATCVDQGSILLTRNLRHFEPLGVPVADPFAPDFPIR